MESVFLVYRVKPAEAPSITRNTAICCPVVRREVDGACAEESEEVWFSDMVPSLEMNLPVNMREQLITSKDEFDVRESTSENGRSEAETR